MYVPIVPDLKYSPSDQGVSQTVAAGNLDGVLVYDPPADEAIINFGFAFADGHESPLSIVESAVGRYAPGQFRAVVSNPDTVSDHIIRWFFVTTKK